MTNKSEMVSVPRDLLERLCMRPRKESLAVNHQDIIDRGRAQAEMRELLADPDEDVRAVVDEPVYQVRSHGSCCWEDVIGESLESCRCQPEHYEIRELYRRPQCSEVSPQCSEHLRTQGKLLPPLTLLPHPPRHWGFLQPEREVPGYTIEQIKEYGAQCAAEALRQNK